MSRQLRSAALALVVLGACPRVQEPVIMRDQFASYTALPKSKLDLQSWVFSLATDALKTIAESEHGILVFDGKSWSPVESGSEEDLNAIWGNKKQLIIAGTAGTLLRSAPDGLSWKKIPSGVRVDLHKLWGNDEVTFAVGDRGAILHTKDGESWSSQASGVKANLRGVWGFSSKEQYVVGDEGTILKTLDGGKTWEAKKSGVTTALLDVWGFSQKKLYAVGEKGVILRSLDQGETWEAQPSGVDFTLEAARGRSLDEIYVSGAGGTVLHLHKDGRWNVETGFLLGGYQFEDTYWSREENPSFASMMAAGDSLMAIGGNHLWTFRTEQDKSQVKLPVFPDNGAEIDTRVAPRFQGIYAASGRTIIVGSQWHHRLLGQVKEALALSDWSDVALHLESVRDMYPERYELSSAYALALLLANDDAGSYMARRVISTFPRPSAKNPRTTDALAAALWFFVGENQAARGLNKQAQSAYLMSQWVQASDLASQKIAKAGCVAELSDKAVKATPFAGWVALFMAIHKNDKVAPSAPNEADAKKELCANEPSGCTGAGPWLLRTTRAALSGKEEAMLSVVFPEGNKLLALPDLYHSPIDHTGIGEALLRSSLTIFKDGLAWVSLEGELFDVSSGEKTGLLQEERFIDTKGKRLVFSLSQKALVQTYGQSPNITREFLFPVEGKLETNALVLTGGGCDRRIKL